jgi:hypothetical protein
MSPRFASERLADVRQDAQLLIEHAGDQEGQLEAFVAAAEEDLRHAEAAGATAAKRLLACAHQQQAAAQRLLAHLRDAAVLTKPATPDAVLAAVRHTANL